MKRTFQPSVLKRAATTVSVLVWQQLVAAKFLQLAALKVALV